MVDPGDKRRDDFQISFASAAMPRSISASPGSE